MVTAIPPLISLERGRLILQQDAFKDYVDLVLRNKSRRVLQTTAKIKWKLIPANSGQLPTWIDLVSHSYISQPGTLVDMSQVMLFPCQQVYPLLYVSVMSAGPSGMKSFLVTSSAHLLVAYGDRRIKQLSCFPLPKLWLNTSIYC